jgi:hypothetical protein
MSYSLELTLYHTVHDKEIYLVDIASDHAPSLAEQYNAHITNDSIILCSIDEQMVISMTNEATGITPTVIALSEDIMQLARARKLGVTIMPGAISLEADVKDLKDKLIDIEKQAYNEKYEKMKQDNKPDKPEIRWRQQQDRYRQKYHSKNFRK